MALVMQDSAASAADPISTEWELDGSLGSRHPVPVDSSAQKRIIWAMNQVDLFRRPFPIVPGSYGITDSEFWSAGLEWLLLRELAIMFRVQVDELMQVRPDLADRGTDLGPSFTLISTEGTESGIYVLNRADRIGRRLVVQSRHPSHRVWSLLPAA